MFAELNKTLPTTFAIASRFNKRHLQWSPRWFTYGAPDSIEARGSSINQSCAFHDTTSCLPLSLYDVFYAWAPKLWTVLSFDAILVFPTQTPWWESFTFLIFVKCADAFVTCFCRVAEEENIDHKFSVARVNCNGTVKWTQRKVFKTSCPIDMRNFPFDRQRCDLVSQASNSGKTSRQSFSLTTSSVEFNWSKQALVSPP